MIRVNDSASLFASGLTCRPSRAFIDEVCAVLRVQREMYPHGADPRGLGITGPFSPVLPLFKAITTTVSAASSTTYGTGQVQLYYSADPDDAFGTADVDNASVPVFNWYTGSGTIPTNTHCHVFPSDNWRLLLTWDC